MTKKIQICPQCQTPLCWKEDGAGRRWYCVRCLWSSRFAPGCRTRRQVEDLIVGEASSRRVWVNGRELLPIRSQKAYNHSPDGFSWGYGGSGPAQLALALMLLFTDRRTALGVYQAFKTAFVAGQIGDFEIPIGSVAEWLDNQGCRWSYRRRSQ